MKYINGYNRFFEASKSNSEDIDKELAMYLFFDRLENNVNKIIKSKKPTEVLNKETGFDLTDYRYKLHRQQCLINFEILIEEQKIELTNRKIQLDNQLKALEKRNQERNEIEIARREEEKAFLNAQNENLEKFLKSQDNKTS